jgi:hypothetical protein
MVVRTAIQRATIRATVKQGDVQPVDVEATVCKYKKSMVRTECEDVSNGGGTYV